MSNSNLVYYGDDLVSLDDDCVIRDHRCPFVITASSWERICANPAHYAGLPIAELLCNTRLLARSVVVVQFTSDADVDYRMWFLRVSINWRPDPAVQQMDTVGTHFLWPIDDDTCCELISRMLADEQLQHSVLVTQMRPCGRGSNGWLPISAMLQSDDDCAHRIGSASALWSEAHTRPGGVKWYERVRAVLLATVPLSSPVVRRAERVWQCGGEGTWCVETREDWLRRRPYGRERRAAVAGGLPLMAVMLRKRGPALDRALCTDTLACVFEGLARECVSSAGSDHLRQLLWLRGVCRTARDAADRTARTVSETIWRTLHELRFEEACAVSWAPQRHARRVLLEYGVCVFSALEVYQNDWAVDIDASTYLEAQPDAQERRERWFDYVRMRLRRGPRHMSRAPRPVRAPKPRERRLALLPRGARRVTWRLGPQRTARVVAAAIVAAAEAEAVQAAQATQAAQAVGRHTYVRLRLEGATAARRARSVGLRPRR